MAHASIARRWIQSILLAASLLASFGAAAQTPGPPSVVLNLAPTTIPFGGGNFATLDIFIGEPSNTGFTNASISFTYPNGVVNSPFGTISNGCGGTLIADPNTGQMTLTGGSNGSGGCSIDLPITATVPGTCSTSSSPTASRHDERTRPPTRFRSPSLRPRSSATRAIPRCPARDRCATR